MHNLQILDQCSVHGTLLFDSDIESVVNALNVKADKISKGIKSVRSRVANIKEFLQRDISTGRIQGTPDG